MSVPTDHIVIAGTGSSPLVADLLDHGYNHVEAIDIAEAALDRLRADLGDRAQRARIRQADVRTVTFDEPVAVWHDRAVFHFLIDDDDRKAYAARATEAVRAGGHLVMATFSLEGPEQCSGLPVQRYDAGTLAAVFDPGFELVESFGSVHVTPAGGEQAYLHAVLRRR